MALLVSACGTGGAERSMRYETATEDSAASPVTSGAPTTTGDDPASPGTHDTQHPPQGPDTPASPGGNQEPRGDALDSSAVSRPRGWVPPGRVDQRDNMVGRDGAFPTGPDRATAPDTETPPVTNQTEAADVVNELAAERYEFDERSERVAALQQLLGVTADGWYGRTTRAAHAAYVLEYGIDPAVVPDTPPLPPEPSTTADSHRDGQLCSLDDVRAFAENVLAPYSIAAPEFGEGGSRSVYEQGRSLILLSPCPTKSVVAHELGHYVIDRAVSYSWSAHVAEVALFSGGGWIKGTELVPGVEHAAHCVGNQLWGHGTYTKCPDERLAELARDLISRAS